MDLLNSEKLETTLGINGYYGEGQMMNWFAPPTTIENVGGVDYESTPHGVPTDEFWWIKQNRLNRNRIKRNLKNTVNIFPNALPSGDRLEDYFNADATQKYIFIADYKAAYPLPACRNYNPPCGLAQKAPRLFKKGEVIEGTPKLASVQCIKAPCPMGTALVGISTADGLTIPRNVLKNLLVSTNQDIKQKYIFTEDFGTFKKGDIIEGNIETNQQYSEPPNFFVSGGMRIGFGGRGKQIIMPYTEQREKELNADKVSNRAKESGIEDKILGMPKNVAYAGLAIILAIGGYFAYKKLK